MTDRTAVHAALADEHRLRIADALALGDRTPGDLAAYLELSSNLLAHHLGVLEGAQVVTRRRSEGDRRRAYVTLRWDNPVVGATVLPPAPLAAPRVVFVCTHNSARSQFAASLFASACDVPVASGGTVPATHIHPLALDVLASHGRAPLHPRPQRWEQVSQDHDLVVAVCDNAFESMTSTVPAHLHWSIPDPAAGGRPEDFAQAFEAITPRVKRLAASLTPGDTHVTVA